MMIEPDRTTVDKPLPYQTRRGRHGRLRMPNLRGKVIRSELCPPLDHNGTAMLRRDAVAANVNRAQRQVAASKRTPWRKPKPAHTS